MADISLDGLPPELAADVAAIARIAVVPSILNVVCQTTGMGFAAVARVTTDRWVLCGVRDDINFGLRPGGERTLATTLCDDVRGSGKAVVIGNVADDARYRGHPTCAMYGFQSYVSVPIVLPDGSLFGTLCAIDPHPAPVDTPSIIGMFKLFAELIGFHVDAHRRLLASAQTLAGERETAELREQFVAVLGHDLRNPLAAINAGTRLLQRSDLPERARSILGAMQASVGLMARLIDDVLDFARCRMGGGLFLAPMPVLLEPGLRHVVAELSATHPPRAIETDFALETPVACDKERVEQVLSNLLANALSHGDAQTPVQVRAVAAEGGLTRSVANQGTRSPRRPAPSCSSLSPAALYIPASRAWAWTVYRQ